MSTKTDARIHQVRRFNRFYTRQIGVLQERLLRSPFSLGEGRILYDLAQAEHITATELGAALGLDPGYLSRVLRTFKKRGLLDKQTSKTDGRQSILRLTPKGRAAFAKLNAQSQSEIGRMLRKLPSADQTRLVESMQTIETLLCTPSEQQIPYILRPHQPGDMGWVVSRHGALYAQEYGWDEQFEALVAEIVSQFLKNFDPKREHCWIAERDGENVGSVFLVKKSDTVAKLRLLLVEPSARGLGVGRRLVEECIRFARQAGYQKITLWTNSVLTAARHIYESVGFQRVESEKHHSFGHDLIGENWDLDLTPAPVSVSENAQNQAAHRGRGRKPHSAKPPTASSLQIRLGTVDEVSVIASVLSQSFAEYKRKYKPRALAATTPDATQLRDRFAEGPVWVAVKDDSIVGTVAAVLKDEGLYVRSMAVLPESRGSGIGKALLEQVERFAHEHNCMFMYLSTTPFLKQAIKLYEQFGFFRSGDGPHELFGTPLFTMVKIYAEAEPYSDS